jgi:hypothetical protein
MLLDYYQKKLELLVYINVSKGDKVGWQKPLNGFVGPTSHGKCRTLLNSEFLIFRRPA